MNRMTIITRKVFVSKYIFSLDHKMIGKQFLIYGLIMFIVGGGLALLFRWQLAWPDKPLPIIGVSQEYLDEGEVVSGADKMWEKWGEDDEENWFERTMHAGIIGPEFYNALFTMHATIMVFFVVVPLLVGAFGNFPDSTDDWHERHGVSCAKYVVFLDECAWRGYHDGGVFSCRVDMPLRVGPDTRRYLRFRTSRVCTGGRTSGASRLLSWAFPR